MSNVYIFSSRGELFSKALIRQIELSLGTKATFDALVFSNVDHYLKTAIKDKMPALVFIDLAAAAVPNKDDGQNMDQKRVQDTEQVVTGFRRLNQHIPIILICDQLPPGTTMMGWFHKGATAMIHEEISVEQIKDSIQDVLSKKMTEEARFLRGDIHHKIVIRLSSFEQALAAETLNIGTGGLFVRSNTNGLKTGDQVYFEFQETNQLSNREDTSVRDPLLAKLDEDLTSQPGALALNGIKGIGKVMWVRPLPDKGMPEGLGIKFVELDQRGQKVIQNFIERHHVRAFIPES